MRARLARRSRYPYNCRNAEKKDDAEGVKEQMRAKGAVSAPHNQQVAQRKKAADGKGGCHRCGHTENEEEHHHTDREIPRSGGLHKSAPVRLVNVEPEEMREYRGLENRDNPDQYKTNRCEGR